MFKKRYAAVKLPTMTISNEAFDLITTIVTKILNAHRAQVVEDMAMDTEGTLKRAIYHLSTVILGE